jgi:hypothetical protein
MEGWQMKSPHDTGTETGRNTIEIENEVGDIAVEAFTPSEDWIQKYKKQCDKRLIDGLNRYARTRALAVAAAGKKVDDYYARSLVLDALGDTWLGIVRWDPDKCNLAHHVIRTIDGRSDKHRKHAEDFPHDSLGDECEASRAAERDASEIVGDAETPLTRVFASETLAQIRTRAGNDKHVLRILDAYDADCETKEQVLVHAKMREATYHKAYVRLRRIVREMSDAQLANKARA